MNQKSIKSNNLKVILGLILFVVIIVVSTYNHFYRRGTIIKQFDNFYNEDNIVLFYEDKNSEELNKLDAVYGITSYVGNGQNEFEKVLKAVNIIHSLCEKDGIKETGLTSGYEILQKKDGGKKVSFKDMAIIARDIVNCTGVKSRIGVFRSEDSQFKNDYEYYVLEYWSSEYSKWVMIDFVDQGYFSSDDNKLSAIEVMNCDLKKTPYSGKTTQKDYKNKLNKFLGSYSVDIENSSIKQRSNCDIAYVKDINAITLKYKDKLSKPTIYTNQTNLFEKSPFNNSVNKDEKAYILAYLSKFKANSGLFANNEEELVISAFSQDKTINEFYIKINDAEYEKVNSYKEIKIKKETVKIQLSLDGEETISSMTIVKN